MLLRELSPFEKYFFYRCYSHLHSCIYHSITLNKLPTRHQLHSTLRKLLQVHPELHYNIVLRDDNKPYLNNITDSPDIFRRYCRVQRLMDRNSVNLKTNYIFQTYYFDHTQETKPLWKILVIPKTSQLVLPKPCNVRRYVVCQGVV